MKFNVAGKTLLQQLTAVSKVINAKNSLNILDNFLFALSGNTLKITGSDSENFMTAELEVMEAEGDGIIAIPAKKLTEALKEVSGHALTFYVNEETLEIEVKFLNGKFKFVGIEGKQYPLPAVPTEECRTLTLAPSQLNSAIESTLFAVGTDTIRPQMTGIYWDVFEDRIVFVATDTHKLVKCTENDIKPGFETHFIMPAKPAGILRSLIGNVEGDIKMELDAKNAKFTFNSYTLSCRFINGMFPPYEKVMPANNPFELTVDRVSLLSAMRRVALFSSMASSLVRLNIQPDEVLLSAQDLDYATSADERVTCEYQGNSMVIGFSAAYMVEVLSNLKADTIVIKLCDPARPALFVPQEQPEGQEIVMLLMPMQVMDY